MVVGHDPGQVRERNSSRFMIVAAAADQAESSGDCDVSAVAAVAAARSPATSCVNRAHSAGRGVRTSAADNIQRARSVSLAPGVASIARCAKAAAASTNVGSFIAANAASGVLVRILRTVQVSRETASKFMSEGCGLDRRQKV